ncbi:hypothetical protein L3Q82_021921 [Scortum barcoo]|uniref:Uncharacterized protein n=1 Tax=Scortum barcoo TaxID=214431 RepID=A0ACB8X644_9TELE|nr:hypothetical protein L3Q82_021921 [Scortum barcoo]
METEETHRKQNRGRMGGLHVLGYKLTNPYRLPSLFLTNARSLVNKMDKMKLRIISAKIEAVIVTETWLDNNIPDAGSGASGALSSPGGQIGLQPQRNTEVEFAYRENRSTEDAVSIALHTALTHLQLPNTYMRMLFVDFSSAFNTVIPDKLILKLHNLGLPSSLCHWIRDFLTNRASGGENRGQHILYTGPEHRHTTGLRAQPSPLHSLHQ